MWEGGGCRVFLLALALFLALQTPASAEKKACGYLITLLMHPHRSSCANLIIGLTCFQVLYKLDAIHGIVAHIDDVFMPRLQQLTGVLGVIQDTLVDLHTTHSWDFLSLASNGQATSAWASDGEFGVWPESESFRDDDLPNVPSRWRGTCDRGNDPTFRCNKKLIGARFFSKGIQLLSSLSNGTQPNSEDSSSPRDYEGHGTHTLSTAGGAFVPDAGVLGRGKGRAAGGSPRARVAAYKACFASGCSGVDVLAAIVAAVADGVDVISLSLGSPASDYLTDLIAIGTFFAVQKGVTVVAAAGNSGPGPSTLSNVAPWMFTVGASATDRSFPAYVNFGGNIIEGQSVANSTLPLGQAYPIISGEQANAPNQATANSTLCLPDSLDPAKVEGKIVVCVGGRGRAAKGLAVKQAGGVGMVLCNDVSFGDTVFVDPHLIPAAHCSYSQCEQLFNYLRDTDNPSGFITTTDVKFGVKPAPKMAAFSSRGPNPITPQILKPDVTAPGVSIIAAYTGAISPSAQPSPFDDRRVPYNVMSGTSMSCPHVSGIVGLLKTKYPSWSPAMIKSAIMTTATVGASDGNPIRDQTGAAATPFSYGSGHVDPVRALDPGLVYDTTLVDYANFLCSLKLRQDPLPSLPVNLPIKLSLPMFDGAAGNPCTCSNGSSFRPEDLNYPSITVPCLTGSTSVKRRVKNVGAKASSYSVTAIEHPTGIKVAVEPDKLSLGVGEEKEFTVKLDVVDSAAAANYVFGSIEWSDGLHRVRSPVVAKTTCG
ncbi:hypothetical protein PR202_gb05062 [Eleusine coracana subsp. coracana]|uniref:Subtilisin-like protease SBT5.3 n=1 Tax=Eleusine coracana subsp. coracana TaxID=191504 RepID=A0AAV5E694_ELECO|nr:hypothetical protein PR202_gb05062 [Eleusine coracana subsp. coracana]